MKDDIGLLRGIREEAAEHAMWAPGDCVVAAVSGGPDSMALLHLLHALSLEQGFALVCAHVNHGLRPEESAAEEELVRQAALRLGVPFELGRPDVAAYKKESGLGTQAAARELRYRFLREAALRRGAAAIALAHHAGDQAETVLLHLLRGSGPAGLAGMRRVRERGGMRLARPLLRFGKADLVGFCAANAVRFAEDSSNAHTDYARNRLRLETLPQLESYNGRLVEALNRLADTLGPEDDYLAGETDRAFERLCRRSGEATELDTAGFAALPFALQRRLVKLILNYLPAAGAETDFAKVDLVRRQLVSPDASTWTLDLGYGRTCTREYDRAFFRLGRPPIETPKTRLLGREPDARRIWFGSRGLTFREEDEVPDSQTLLALGADEAAFDADRLEYPLTVRSRLPGDRIELPRGAGTKKVKDLLIDEKIAPSERGLVPVVCDARGRVVWLAGLRRSAHAWVDGRTEKILYIRMDRALC
ncbi:tRNA lysidine(34) synthetase TilS [Saccharibacillus sp. CPCC 101409]|uniref:tRNA lysidine(34) synthetase TilS n=1 Tax=Saccharibacillus sp. CPCC 101409 TaxID=3058041 RepID=UPI00267103E5|nr:tRNA lysidine(34) synthetase TilS [Saccharibacillus sp. CPCC 101409]MDO3412892.1 tRNA lysidine(34) synthetase TilS [Saccharibacillus sp. CPCC 101409]